MKPIQKFLIKVLEILFGTTLKKLAAFGLAYLGMNEISVETVNRFAENVGSFFQPGRIRELIISAINLVGEYMGTDDIWVKSIIGLITLLLVLWLIYEEYLKYTFNRKDVPVIEIKEGKLYFFGVAQEKLGWLAYRRLNWAYNVSFRLQAMPIHVPIGERLKLKHYQKLQYEFPGEAVSSSSKKLSKTGIVRHIIKNILTAEGGSQITFILGDSGMGKSMVLLKVYHDYLFPSWRFSKGQYQILLIRHRDFEEKRRQWEVNKLDSQQTILLIDALDEDATAYDSGEQLAASLQQLDNYGFYRILITCRIQFFASRLREPSQDFGKVYVTGFSKRTVRRYIRKRFPFRGWRFGNFRLRRRARRIIRQNQEIAGRPLIIDWICELVAEVDKGQLAPQNLDYPYQLYERLIGLWYKREKKTLERYGFQVSFTQVQQWMEALAIHFYEHPMLNNQLGEHLLKDLFPEKVIAEGKQEQVKAYLQQGRTRSLLSRDESGYFFFAHRSIWEIIMTRLLFDGYKVNYDAIRVGRYEAIQDFYNQMCWEEIVPASRFPRLDAHQKRQINLYCKEDLIRWLRSRDGLGFHDDLIRQFGNLPARILEFRDPAVRASFLGMEATEFTKVFSDGSRFAIFRDMLYCWIDKASPNGDSFLEFLKNLTSAIKKHILNSEGVFTGNLKSIFRSEFEQCKFPEPPDAYLAEPYSLFILNQNGKIYFRHKSILDFLLVHFEEGLPLAFKDHYSFFHPFALDEWSTRAGVDLYSETIQIQVKKDLLLLHYHHNKELPRHLYLDELGLKDITFLSTFQNMKVLCLSGNEIEDISSLSNLERLTLLELNKNRIDDLTALSKLSNLEELYLSNNEVKSVLPLKDLGKLEVLNLNKNNSCHWSGLLELPQLRELSIVENNIQDLSVLRHSQKLIRLDARDNQIDDLAALKKLPDLEELVLSGNQIDSVDEFLKLKKLKKLDLHNNEISSNGEGLKPLLLLPRLTFLNLHGNPLAKDLQDILEEEDNSNCLFNLKKHILDNPLDLVLVEGGTFTMGWLNEERDGNGRHDGEKPAHEVTLDSFFIGKYQVTFEEYDSFCESTGREKLGDEGWGRGRRPVINVHWYDAIEYCNWLSEIWGLEKVYNIDKEKEDPNIISSDNKKWLVTFNKDANGFRIPTEAEWEYAARGGQESKGYPYAGSKDLNEVGWYMDNAGGKTHPVGEKKPNELGLYDMSGNVYEWCWDWFSHNYYQSSPKDDPQGPDSSFRRVRRGGHWCDNPPFCRVAYRNLWSVISSNNNFVSFRLVRS